MGSHKKESIKLDGVPGAISAHYLWGNLNPLFGGFLEGDLITSYWLHYELNPAGPASEF